MSKYNSKCPLDCNTEGCGIQLCQRYADYQQGKVDGAIIFCTWLLDRFGAKFWTLKVEDALFEYEKEQKK